VHAWRFSEVPTFEQRTSQFLFSEKKILVFVDGRSGRLDVSRGRSGRGIPGELLKVVEPLLLMAGKPRLQDLS